MNRLWCSIEAALFYGLAMALVPVLLLAHVCGVLPQGPRVKCKPEG